MKKFDYIGWILKNKYGKLNEGHCAEGMYMNAEGHCMEGQGMVYDEDGAADVASYDPMNESNNGCKDCGSSNANKLIRR